jgi:DNA-binding MarR family transcriptional regulator
MPQFLPKLPSLGPRPPDTGPGHQPPAAVDAIAGAQTRSPTVPSPAAPAQDASGGSAGPGVSAESGAAAPASDPAVSRSPRSSPMRLLRGPSRPFLHMPSLSVPSRAAVESAARELLAAPVEAARLRLQNPRELSDRIAMGRAIWRDLVVGFAAQLGELNLGFTQLAALYALADGGTMTVADLADTLGRSPSTVSRLADGLVQRQLIERKQDAEDRRQRTLTLTGRGQALLGLVDRARAQEFLAIVRPLPAAERALVAMGVAALSTHAISRRGRLIKQRPREGRARQILPSPFRPTLQVSGRIEDHLGRPDVAAASVTLRAPLPPRATVTALSDPAVAWTRQNRVCMGRAARSQDSGAGASAPRLWSFLPGAVSIGRVVSSAAGCALRTQASAWREMECVACLA